MSKNRLFLSNQNNNLKNSMNRKFNLVLFFFIVLSFSLDGQIIKGKITAKGDVVPFANVVVGGSSLGVSTNKDGVYEILNSPLGHQHLIVSSVGMLEKKAYIDIVKGVNIINIELEPSVYNLDQVVVTGTKTFKRRTESPVIVNVIDSRQLESVQACNLAEGLNFQQLCL